jgi:hypothetical protein
MKHIRKIYESQYNNTALEDDEFDSYRRQSIPFGKRDITQILDYFSQWDADNMFYVNQNSVGPGHKLGEQYFNQENLPMVRIERLRYQSDSDMVISRTITIFKLPDEYYLVFDWTSYGNIGKIRCDDIGGLKEYFDEVLKKYPKVGGDFQGHLQKVEQIRKKLKFSIQSMMSNMDDWPMERIKSLDDFLKSSKS